MQRFLSGIAALAALAIVLVPVPAAAQGADWAPGPGAVLDASSYAGFIDVPSAGATVATGGFTVAGWFVDRTAQGWAGADDVQVFLGAMGGDGRMLAKAQFAQSRPDVGTALGSPYWAASGFNAFVPAGAVPAGNQTLSLYVHTPGKGWWFKNVQVNVSASAPTAQAPAPGGFLQGAVPPVLVIEQPKDAERVGTKDEFEVIGYALDPNAQRGQGSQNTGIDRVDVYVNAERDAGGTHLGTADLAYSSTAAEQKYGAQFTNSGFRLRFKPTTLKAEGHELFVYAHSVVSNKETLEIRNFEVFEN